MKKEKKHLMKIDERTLDYDMQSKIKTQGELLMVGQKIQQLISREFPILDKN